MHSQTPFLAAFVTPTLAVAGAAAVSLPILIHLLARRRFKRIRWAAMDFLIDAERRNRRRVRMEEWILLALRCLAVLLLGFLVARPFVTPSGFASALGGGRRIERVFVLDDSFSMGLETPGGSPFDRAKNGVRRVIESARRDTPDDTVTVLRTSTPGKAVESGASLDQSGADQLLARLEGTTLTQRSMELSTVFEGIAEALQRDAGITSAAVYFLGDFQRKDWTPREAGGSALTASLAAWAAQKRNLRMVLVNVGEENTANTAAVSLEIPTGQLVAGAPGTIRAGVANFSDRTLDNVNVQLTIASRPPTSKTLPSLAEHQTASIDLDAEFPSPGDEAARVTLPPDALPLDNQRYAAVEVVSAIRILVVNGEPSADEFDDEAALLTTALRPEGEVFSGHDVIVVDEAGLEQANLSTFHAVILANVYRIPEPVVEPLERFVRGGGGLVVFLGDQVDSDLYNTTLFRDGAGVLPAALGQVIRSAEGAHWMVADRLHPAFRAVGREDDPLGIAQVPFHQYIEIRAGDEKQADAKPGDARIIVRFDDDEAHPAVVEKSFGRGRVLLLASSADKEWNLFADHPTYLPIVTELIRRVARSGDSRGETLVGQPIELTVDPTEFVPEVIVRTPEYPTAPESTLTATPGAEGDGLKVRWEQTEEAGSYQFVQRRPDGSESTKIIAVNVDAAESDLTPASETDIRRTMGGLPFEYVRGIDRLVSAAGEARIELWKPILLLAMVVLMSEQFLAWRWGRRR